jgi:hypothetical protein
VCPVCHGLECLCRPRFFAGQLITDTELNAQTDYVIKKNRLHNLYLHGWGVVCGLEVLCHPSCDGWVTIKQGYAISPCGDDIIVCDDHDFDVMAAIEKCLRERRQQRPEDCSPHATPTSDCDADGRWCISLVYQEDALRPMMALRPEMQRTTPACTCPTHGCAPAPGRGCGCGCSVHGASYSKASNGHTGYGTATMTASRRPPAPACEPTRWCEGYRVELCQQVEDDDVNYDDLLGDTLLGRAFECLSDIQALIAQAPSATAQLSPSQRYSACCRFLVAVRTFLESHPTTQCEIIEQFSHINCPPAPDLENSPQVAEYPGLVAGTVQTVVLLLARFYMDCVCLQLLPPCPEDPGDERVCLGCVTVREGKIVDICLLKCRKHVWTWPTVRYWLSAYPIVPVLSLIFQRFCCGEYGFGVSTGIVNQPNLGTVATPSYETVNEFQVLQQMGQLFQTAMSAVGQTGGSQSGGS